MLRRILPRVTGEVVGAIAVIAVGTGLAAMVFALSDAFVLKPLPYADPDRLVSIGFGLPGDPRVASTDQADFPSLASWQARHDLFEGIAAFEESGGWMRVQVADRILPLRAVAATPNLFEVLGMNVRWTDAGAGWVSRRTVSLSAGALEPGRSARIVPEGVLRVVGVLPSTFLLPDPGRTDPVDVITPLAVGPVKVLNGAQPTLVARLRPGLTPETAQAALSASMASTGYSPSVVPLNRRVKTGYPQTYGNAATAARVSSLAAGALLTSVIILFLCWAHVFNLAMTRGLYRQAELATRTALGATSGRIVGHLAADTARIAAVGSAAALLFAWLTLSTAVAVLPPAFATLGLPSMTPRVAAFVGLAGVFSGVSWCLASVLAWRLTRRRELHQVISGDGSVIRVVRFALVAGQIGVAGVFLAGTTLLARSYLNLVTVDIGMDEDTRTVTVAHDSVPLPLRRNVVNQVLTLLRRAEGVRAVGAKAHDLFRSGSAHVTSSEVQFYTDRIVIVGDYFDALGITFVAGRPQDSSVRAAAVVTESFAQQYSGGRMPTEVIFTGGWKTLPVMGVVRDVRTRGPALPSRPTIFEVSEDWRSPDAMVTYVLRVAGRSSPAVWERLIHDVDPHAIVLESGMVGERLGRAILERTFATVVVGIFAAATIMVTALGLAGVVAHTVVKRTREIAVRLALGATAGAVTRLVVRDAIVAGACGVAGGAIVSVWLSGTLQSLLYEVSPTDAAAFSVTIASLLGIVVFAALVPAVRAGRVPPATALRAE
jgi:hypothetical protein